MLKPVFFSYSDVKKIITFLKNLFYKNRTIKRHRLSSMFFNNSLKSENENPHLKEIHYIYQAYLFQ